MRKFSLVIAFAAVVMLLSSTSGNKMLASTEPPLPLGVVKVASTVPPLPLGVVNDDEAKA